MAPDAYPVVASVASCCPAEPNPNPECPNLAGTVEMKAPNPPTVMSFPNEETAGGLAECRKFAKGKAVSPNNEPSN